MKYQPLSYFLKHIDEPNASRCKNLFTDFQERFKASPGSLRKHQAWKGGYIHHVEETMNLGAMMYKEMNLFRKLPFTFSDVLLVLFIHDMEKPFRYVLPKKEFRNDVEKHEFIESLIKNIR